MAQRKIEEVAVVVSAELADNSESGSALALRSDSFLRDDIPEEEVAMPGEEEVQGWKKIDDEDQEDLEEEDSEEDEVSKEEEDEDEDEDEDEEDDENEESADAREEKSEKPESLILAKMEEAYDRLSDYGLLEEFPSVVLTDRNAMIDKLRESKRAQSELKRKNRLLEYRVAKHMQQTRETPLPAESAKRYKEAEDSYNRTLSDYKLYVDEIESEKAEITRELNDYRKSVGAMRDEERKIFDELLERERAVGVDLTYAKSGRKLTEKAVESWILRQRSRREVLAVDRYLCIRRRHRLEELDSMVRSMKMSGGEFDVFDYEDLKSVNAIHQEKLDEREYKLERRRTRLKQFVSLTSQMTQKAIFLGEDIALARAKLAEYQNLVNRGRERLAESCSKLTRFRRVYNQKRKQAGLLAIPTNLREMEETLNALNAVKKDTEACERAVRRKSMATSSGEGLPRNTRLRRDRRLSTKGGATVSPAMKYDGTSRPGRR